MGLVWDALRHNLHPALLHFVPPYPTHTIQKPRSPAPDPAPSKPSDPEYSPDWPSDLIDESEDESEDEEFDLGNEDGMKSKSGSDIDVDSDVEVEEEDQAFSLSTEFLEDEVHLEQLLSQAEKRGNDADEEEWVPPRVRLPTNNSDANREKNSG
ncbi:hypothetical protein B0H14DRAFT_2574147 [Mycena olivaceomarginata]|nr:hypothetical protein B0H14DRAFT_2574147 [Mycena olivaceomarginata]